MNTLQHIFWKFGTPRTPNTKHSIYEISHCLYGGPKKLLFWLFNLLRFVEDDFLDKSKIYFCTSCPKSALGDFLDIFPQTKDLNSQEFLVMGCLKIFFGREKIPPPGPELI